MAADDRYVSLGGLAHYDEKIKEYAKDHCAVLEDANWQKTGTAGAVSFLPAPEMQLDPVVNFKFTETAPASGTKGPDNPSTITGVTQAKVTRAGKNLLPFPYEGSAGESNGIVWTVNADGSIVANGTATADSGFSIVQSHHNNIVKMGVTYTISGCPSGGSTNTYCIRFGDSVGASDTGNSVTFVADAGIVGKSIWIKITSGTTVSNLVFKPQLELGSTATSFEPYAGTDYTVQLGDTYYGGSVDFSTGIMTVTHTSVALDGTETWYGGAQDSDQGYHGFACNVPSGPANLTQVCTHFEYSNSLSTAFQHFVVVGPGVHFFATQETTTAFKAWLADQYTAGTPVTICYTLTTPYTVQLTPTQIKSLSALSKYEPRTNTVYSDQESVQVGYPKSPIATDTELTNAIISLGGNV